MAYKTRQSAEILSLLTQNKERHLTAEEVYMALKNKGEQIGQTTVYRQLERLFSEGRVRKFAGAQGCGACFQYAENGEVCHAHYHLKCVSCGCLLHAECDFLNTLSEHIQKEHGFTVDNGRTVLYGLCAACTEKGEQL